jgi:hypothetical protein
MAVYGGQAARDRKHVPFATGSFYMIDCMAVAAILAVIFVSYLTDMTDESASRILTAPGVSYALAAGLVGDSALRVLRKLFEHTLD